jgi:hypothetical protein
MEEACDDLDIIILNLPPWSALEINALQRTSTLIVQKFIARRFRSYRYRGALEEQTHDCRRCGRHPQQGDPQIDWRTRKLSRRMCLPDPVSSYPSRVRCRTGKEWPGACERKLSDKHRRQTMDVAVSHRDGLVVENPATVVIPKFYGFLSGGDGMGVGIGGLANLVSSIGTFCFTCSSWMVKRPPGRAIVQRNGVFTPSTSR